MFRRGLLAVVGAGSLAAIVAVAYAQPLGEGWLLGAPDDATRFQLLERDAGGTGRTMFEMSVRFERMYAAIADGDLQVALHNWEGIEGSLSRGLTRRPDRADTANAFLLDTLWDEVAADLESGDIVRARAGFVRAKEACMGCHVASDLAYLNDQRLFRDMVFN